MKANFIITGDTDDVELMRALNGLLARGYPYKVTAIKVAEKNGHEVAPKPPAAPIIAQPVMPPKTPGTYVPYRRKFFHPSGKSADVLALEYINKMQTTTVMDVAAYLVKLGYAKNTPQAVISNLATKGLIELEGNYVGSKVRR